MIRRFAVALLGLAVAGPVLSAPKDDLHAAFVKFLAQTSFKGNVDASMMGHKMHSTVEFQAPDRYRVAADGRPPSVIIGSQMYLNIGGRSMKMAMPAGMSVAQYRDASILAQLEHGITVEDQGMDSVGGAPAHKYRYTVAQPHPSTSTIWVGASTGLPVQLQTARPIGGKSVDTTISYSNYSDPAIKIAAPN